MKKKQIVLTRGHLRKGGGDNELGPRTVSANCKGLFYMITGNCIVLA